MKIPMMPKGVEHPTHRSEERVLKSVKIPMMPKGVEHIFTVRSGSPPLA